MTRQRWRPCSAALSPTRRCARPCSTSACATPWPKATWTLSPPGSFTRPSDAAPASSRTTRSRAGPATRWTAGSAGTFLVGYSALHHLAYTSSIHGRAGPEIWAAFCIQEHALHRFTLPVGPWLAHRAATGLLGLDFMSLVTALTMAAGIFAVVGHRPDALWLLMVTALGVEAIIAATRCILRDHTRRAVSCADADACVCGSSYADGRDLVVHADQWVGWHTEGIAEQFTQALRSHPGPDDPTPARWRLQNWCLQQGWLITGRNRPELDRPDLCCSIEVIHAATSDGRRYAVVQVGRRQPVVYHVAEGHRWSEAADVDIVCASGHRWAWDHGMVHGADLGYASMVQVFGSQSPVDCAGATRRATPRRCALRVLRCPLCGHGCALQVAASPGVRQLPSLWEPTDGADIQVRESGGREVRIIAHLRDGATRYTVWLGFHNTTGWRGLPALPDAQQLAVLADEPRHWGAAYRSRPFVRMRRALPWLIRTVTLGARLSDHLSPTGAWTSCEPGCFCRRTIDEQLAENRSRHPEQQQMRLFNGRPVADAEAWVAQRVGSLDWDFTEGLRWSPQATYRPADVSGVRAWCEASGWMVHDEITEDDLRFLSYETGVVLASSPDGTRHAIVVDDRGEESVYLDRTVDPAVWRSAGHVILTCPDGHQITWDGEGTVVDPVAGNLPVKALFGSGRRSPVQVCRACRPTRCRDTDVIAVFCDRHHGHLEREDVPEAAYCPVCDQLCQLTLAVVETDPQVAVSPR
ncbi:hypothetical protein AB0B66_10325 [Catellatospora sp. NPDC049111]|uniref:hypothetical protein n=1 Tax=Catellatospora sp. NPDC049111 TaxID=3155271 RepID=UPI0033C97F2A